MVILLALALGLVVGIGSVIWVATTDRERLVEEAITDPLTGAFNRRHMVFCLDQAVARYERTGEPASILLLDIDNFKRINDTWGHAQGDAVLKRVAAFVGERGRRLDVLFRLGGEEFVLLLPATSAAGARLVAESLRAAVADAALLADGSRLSISVGVSELCPEQTAAGWIDDADAAMYRAKQGGRNRVSLSCGLALKSARVM